MTIYILYGGKIICSLERETFGLNSNYGKVCFLRHMDQNEKIPGSPNVIKLSLP